MSTNNAAFDDAELKAAEAEAEDTKAEAATAANPYVYVIKLKEPFSYEGETYDKLTLNCAKLTGKDSLAIENEMSMLGKGLIAPEFSGDYMSRMACRACEEKIPLNALMAMPMYEFNKVRSKMRSFLLATKS